MCEAATGGAGRPRAESGVRPGKAMTGEAVASIGQSTRNGGSMRDHLHARLPNLTRRVFLSTAGASAAAVAIAGCAPASHSTAERGAVAAGRSSKAQFPFTLRINGKEHRLRVDPRTTLLDCVRDRRPHRHEAGLRPRAVRRCTVHVNGRRVNSCLTLALACEAGSRRSRSWAPRRRVTRSRRRSIETSGPSAGTARRGRSWRRWGSSRCPGDRRRRTTRST